MPLENLALKFFCNPWPNILLYVHYRYRIYKVQTNSTTFGKKVSHYSAVCLHFFRAANFLSYQLIRLSLVNNRLLWLMRRKNLKSLNLKIKGTVAWDPCKWTPPPLSFFSSMSILIHRVSSPCGRNSKIFLLWRLYIRHIYIGLCQDEDHPFSTTQTFSNLIRSTCYSPFAKNS
jgi:hypothetical protein